MTVNMFGLVALVLATTLIVAVTFAIVTDGRYFGKPLVRWIYDRLGPQIFAARSEHVTWNELAARLDLRAGDRFLDIGTAVGDLPISLAVQGEPSVRAIGLEISMPMARAADRSAKLRGVADKTGFVVADAASPLPFVNNAFGCAAALGVLETLRDPTITLREMDRVLQPDGILVLSVYTGPSSWVASLGEGWYRQQLGRLGPYRCRRVRLRRSHDALLAHRSISHD